MTGSTGTLARWLRHWPWIVGIVVAFLAGIGIGIAAQQEALADATTVAELEQRQDELAREAEQLDERDAELSEREDGLSASETELSERESVLDDRQSDLDQRATELDDREAALDERAAQLDEREAKISTAEEEAAANTFGNGVYVVGEDIEPGEYRTDGPGSADICYYAFLTGTGSDADIIDNNIVEGQARVTLQEGDIFESSQCQQWERSS